MEVILLMAMTLDGKIARNSRQLVDWTGKADKQYFVRVTRKAGVVIMGSRTFDTIGKPLAGRKNIVMTRDPNRKSQEENLIFTDQSAGEIIRGLEKEGFEAVTLIGGAIVNSLFAKENLITQIHVTLVPVLFGQGLSLFKDSLDLKLELAENREIDKGHLLLVYRVIP
ncbi:MAG: dihydrofolate reductase family protein [Proteobacteria bacterium]|nr:dihydrofolate reductase [Desulfobacula sp.]MBU3952657.1 dihydrofolate reductase family protein [Pseudomonadota bacterium]MBU4132164.1 dihydrofolate reductase family protein [Pseudomonadota bacterium]